MKGCLSRYLSVLPFPRLCLSLKIELSSENATEEEKLDTFYTIILDCVIDEAKAPVLDVCNLVGFGPRDPIAQELL